MAGKNTRGEMGIVCLFKARFIMVNQPTETTSELEGVSLAVLPKRSRAEFGALEEPWCLANAFNLRYGWCG
jgi:hypothetical protein